MLLQRAPPALLGHLEPARQRPQVFGESLPPVLGAGQVLGQPLGQQGVGLAQIVAQPDQIGLGLPQVAGQLVEVTAQRGNLALEAGQRCAQILQVTGQRRLDLLDSQYPPTVLLQTLLTGRQRLFQTLQGALQPLKMSQGLTVPGLLAVQTLLQGLQLPLGLDEPLAQSVELGAEMLERTLLLGQGRPPLLGLLLEFSQKTVPALVHQLLPFTDPQQVLPQTPGLLGAGGDLTLQPPLLLLQRQQPFVESEQTALDLLDLAGQRLDRALIASDLLGEQGQTGLKGFLLLGEGVQRLTDLRQSPAIALGLDRAQGDGLLVEMVLGLDPLAPLLRLLPDLPQSLLQQRQPGQTVLKAQDSGRDLLQLGRLLLELLPQPLAILLESAEGLLLLLLPVREPSPRGRLAVRSLVHSTLPGED